MKKIFSIIFLVALSVTDVFSASLSEQADSAYNKEDYQLAINLYNQLLEENGRNAEVFYNLGNAWYRSGNISQAVLAYERALRIDPSMQDARINLDFVQSRLQDKPENNESFLTRTHMQVVTAKSANSWAWIAFFAFLVMLGFVAAYIFGTNVRLRKLGFFGAVVLLIFVVYFIVVAHDAAARFNDHSEAIVIVPSTLLNSAPRQPAVTEKVVPIHEGTKVEIVDSVSTPDDPVSPRWYKVKINGSNSAWLRATDVTRI